MSFSTDDVAEPPVLNETKSFWLHNAPYQNIQTQPFPKSVDIAIVGAGISGVSIVYHLMEYYTKHPNTKQMDILLLDSRGVCGGATGRNGGIMRNKKTKFEKITYKDMISIIKKYKMEQYIELETKYNKYSKNIYWSGSTFCAAKFVFKLIDIIMIKYRNHFHLQTQTTVHRVICNKNDNTCTYKIETEQNGIKRYINTKYIIYATNGYTSYLLPEYKHKIYPKKNQIIMTKPVIIDKGMNVLKEVIFGNSYDYWYQRNDNRILIGGGRNSGYAYNKWRFEYNDSINKIDKKITNYLINKYLRHYTDNISNIKFKPEFVWQGILGFTDDGLPFVGALPNKNNAYICAGFNGSGMSLIFNCAKMISSMIIGIECNPFGLQFLPTNRINKSSKL